MLQCIDNNVFFGIDEDGCLNLPRQLEGRYHIECGLKGANREQVNTIIK